MRADIISPLSLIVKNFLPITVFPKAKNSVNIIKKIPVSLFIIISNFVPLLLITLFYFTPYIIYLSSSNKISYNLSLDLPSQAFMNLSTKALLFSRHRFPFFIELIRLSQSNTISP